MNAATPNPTQADLGAQPEALHASHLPITLDGEPHQVPAGSTVAELVARCGHEPAAVATALNGQFLPRGSRAQRQLQAGDAVLFFQPIVGG